MCSHLVESQTSSPAGSVVELCASDSRNNLTTTNFQELTSEDRAKETRETAIAKRSEEERLLDAQVNVYQTDIAALHGYRNELQPVALLSPEILREILIYSIPANEKEGYGRIPEVCYHWQQVLLRRRHRPLATGNRKENEQAIDRRVNDVGGSNWIYLIPLPNLAIQMIHPNHQGSRVNPTLSVLPLDDLQDMSLSCSDGDMLEVLGNLPKLQCLRLDSSAGGHFIRHVLDNVNQGYAMGFGSLEDLMVYDLDFYDGTASAYAHESDIIPPKRFVRFLKLLSQNNAEIHRLYFSRCPRLRRDILDKHAKYIKVKTIQWDEDDGCLDEDLAETGFAPSGLTLDKFSDDDIPLPLPEEIIKMKLLDARDRDDDKKKMRDLEDIKALIPVIHGPIAYLVSLLSLDEALSTNL
ncbi:hypothetical protein FA15DRAFT_702485 [Coprinopsis marcescibilis]|uniref:Uncharacterized protein n=1 Tax=Coprinopsis marcescibilis TaxID=230819 RepID=A0A5C3L1R1_COPMA|nr:hypothetical protein FA15DRAFT_702485 [Coprinopsis marcescibilis]